MRIRRHTIAIVFLFLASIPTFGQGPTRTLSDPLFLLEQPQVRKELKIDEKQLTRLLQVIRERKDSHADDLKRVLRMTAEERQKYLASLSKEITQALDKVLRPEQAKRLRQITLQQIGPQAFSEPDVQQALNLTAEQKEKIRQIQSQAKAKRQDILQGDKTNYEQAMKKLANHAKKIVAKITGVLTEEQKKTWEGMIGAPFELKLDSPAQRLRNDKKDKG